MLQIHLAGSFYEVKPQCSNLWKLLLIQSLEYITLKFYCSKIVILTKCNFQISIFLLYKSSKIRWRLFIIHLLYVYLLMHFRMFWNLRNYRNLHTNFHIAFYSFYAFYSCEVRILFCPILIQGVLLRSVIIKHLCTFPSPLPMVKNNTWIFF